MATESKQFLYQRVEKAIRSAIESGKYIPGQRLPDERKLAKKMKVSRATVGLAIRALSKENLVDRIQGRGSFVSSSLRRGQYVCLVAVGPSSKYNPFVGLVTACAEKSFRKIGLQLSVRFLDEQSELPVVLRQIEQDSTVFGAIQVGRVEAAQLEALAPNIKLPWVRIGEFFDCQRRPAVIDQVVGDSYLRAHALTQYMVEQGVRSAVLFAWDDRIVWSRETIDGFRTALDAVGVPVSRQQVVNLSPPSEYESKSGHDHRNIAVFSDLLHAWDRQNAWPDALIMDGAEYPLLWEALHRNPQHAQRMSQTAIGLLDFEESYENRSWITRRPRLAWSLVSVAHLTDLAVSYLAEDRSGGRAPRRTYLRDVRVVPFHDGGVADAAVGAAASPGEAVVVAE